MKIKELIDILQKMNNPEGHIACAWITEDDLLDKAGNYTHFFKEGSIKLDEKDVPAIVEEIDANFHDPSFAPEDNHIDYDEIVAYAMLWHYQEKAKKEDKK